IFWMPQQPYLPKGELIAALTYPQSPETMTEEAAQELLSAAHLDHLKEKLYDSGDWSALLSGGEQQRLSLLRALIVKPDILLLDEMTSGLDPVNAHWMIALLKEKLPQTAMLLVTHQQSLWPLADHIINLQGPAHGQSVHSVSQM
uniref:ATP-binding cassette domain-containing protein n=1 Tax=Sutterella wadsworthensis TaxID=40545 RepID=UPI00402A9719